MGNCSKTVDILTLNGCYVGDNLKILQFLNNNILAIVENGKVIGQIDLSEYREIVDEFSINPIKIGAGETRTLPFNPNSTGANTEKIDINLGDLQFSYTTVPTRTQVDNGPDFDVTTTITDITCNKLNDYGNNEATGIIVAVSTDPTATYVWTDSNANEIGYTDTLNGLVPGTYTAVISTDTHPDYTINVSVLTAGINNEISIDFKTSTLTEPDFTNVNVSHTFNTNYYINDACTFLDFVTALGQYFDGEPYDDGGNTVVPPSTGLQISNVNETDQTFTITNINIGVSTWFDINATLKGGNFSHTSGEIVSNVSLFDMSTFDWTSAGSNSIVIEMNVLEDGNSIIFDTSFFDNDITSFAEFIASLQSFIGGASYTDGYGLTRSSNIGDYITLENVDNASSTFELHSTSSGVSYTFNVTPNLNIAVAPFLVTGVNDEAAITVSIPSHRYIAGSIKSIFILAEFCDQCTSTTFKWAYLQNPCTGSTTDLLWQTAGGMLSLSGANDLTSYDVNRIPPVAVYNPQNCDIWLTTIIVQ